MQAVVISGEDEVVGQSRHPTPTTGGPGDVVAALAGALSEAAAEAGVKTSALAGIGVGSPGEIDDAKGTVARASNLPGMTEPHPVGPELSQQLGAPVRLGNDVSVATLAEFELGAGRPYRSILGVFWGTGVGGGLILDGKPWHGRGGAGEIGHMVVKRNGAQCPCGRRGLHGGLRGPQGDRGRGAGPGRRRREDDAVQGDGEEGQGPRDERRDRRRDRRR